MTSPQPAPPHLALVGLMGAGKSAVGARCATRLGRPFLDTDELVEVLAAATVAEIFATEGEAGFRARERDAVAQAAASPEPLVVACGGGAVVDAENRRRLRGAAVVIWLRASPEVLAARVGRGEGRPLLAGAVSAGGVLPANVQGVLGALAADRDDAYRAAAHATVATDGWTLDDVTDAVLKEYARCTG